jgi:hypothetical protein
MPEACDSLNTRRTPLWWDERFCSRGIPRSLRQDVVAGSDSRGLQFWIQAGLPLIRWIEREAVGAAKQSRVYIWLAATEHVSDLRAVTFVITGSPRLGTL